MRKKIKDVEEYVTLYRDTKSGIAWVDNGKTGQEHSCHASIDISGSVRGMKKQGYWGKADRIIIANGGKYNIDTLVVSDALDEIVRQHCQCGGKHE
jgi:hypothetical protein